MTTTSDNPPNENLLVDDNQCSNRIVNFQALLDGEDDAVDKTCRFLRQDGFIFLDFEDSKEFLSRVNEPFEIAATYLEAFRGQGSTTELHGHVSGKHKDSLRLLTGNQFHTNPTLDDSDEAQFVTSAVKDLARVMDESATQVVQVLAKPLLGATTTSNAQQQVGDDYRLPLLQSKPRNDQAYGLLDIVCYHNDDSDSNKHGDNKIVVSAHQDPGLLVLALPQMAPGLELLHSSKKDNDTTTGHDNNNNTSGWVSPPRNMGVLWAGCAASNVLTPCHHRVVRHATARMACWHEICTEEQIAAPYLQHLELIGQELELGSGGESNVVVGTKAVLDYLRRAENHETLTTTVRQQQGNDSEKSKLPFDADISRRERRTSHRSAKTATKDSNGDSAALVRGTMPVGMPISKSASFTAPVNIKKHAPFTSPVKKAAQGDHSTGNSLILGGMPMSKAPEYLFHKTSNIKQGKETRTSKKKAAAAARKLKKKKRADPSGTGPDREEEYIPLGLPIGKVIHLKTAAYKY